MKKLIGIIMLTILTIGVTTGCGCEKKNKKKETKEDEVKVNTNKDVIKDQNLEVFTFTNTSLIYENGRTTLETLVTNTSDNTETLSEFHILVKDKEGKEMITLVGFVGDQLKGKEQRLITSYTNEDLTKASSIEYSIVR